MEESNRRSSAFTPESMKICLPRREDVEAAHAAAEAAAADAADRTADMAAQLAAAQAAAAGAEQAAAETTALRRVWMLLTYHVCTLVLVPH